MADIPKDPTDRVNWLHNYWKDPSNPGSFAGGDRLYATLQAEGHDFTRKEVRDFVRMSSTNQIHQQTQKPRIVKPIHTTTPFQHIQLDVTQMQGGAYPYILNAVDLYTKYLWSQAYRTPLTVEKVKKFIESEVLPTVGRTQYAVKVVQTDNGPEFQGDLATWLQARGIKHITSLPYKSTSQGAVEKVNQTLKQYLAKYMTEYNTRDWYPILDKIVSNYNNTVHSVTGKRPAEVLGGEAFHVARARGTTPAPDNLPPLAKSDHVRVALRTTSEVAREGDFRKGYLPNWSQEVYVVTSKSTPKSKLSQPQYRIATLSGEPVPRLYYRAELLKVPFEVISPKPADKPKSGPKSAAAAVPPPNSASRKWFEDHPNPNAKIMLDLLDLYEMRRDRRQFYTALSTVMRLNRGITRDQFIRELSESGDIYATARGLIEKYNLLQ